MPCNIFAAQSSEAALSLKYLLTIISGFPEMSVALIFPPRVLALRLMVMPPGNSLLGLQPYDWQQWNLDITEQSENVIGQEGYEADETSYEQRMNQLLLLNSRTSIRRNPVSSTAFPPTPNNQNRRLSALTSESDSETETIRGDAVIYLVESGKKIASRDDDKNVTDAPPEGWPASPMTVSQRDLGKRFEIYAYTFMAFVCLYFLDKTPSRMFTFNF
jgi:hypothetical protein